MLAYTGKITLYITDAHLCIRYNFMQTAVVMLNISKTVRDSALTSIEDV